MAIYSLFAGLIVLFLGTLSGAAQTITPAGPAGNLPSSTCSLIEMTARLNALPVDFFTRLLWQESRFQPDVVGPLTRVASAPKVSPNLCPVRPPIAVWSTRPIQMRHCQSPPSSWPSCAVNSAT